MADPRVDMTPRGPGALTPPSPSKTLYRKVWDAHVILEAEGGQSLLHVARHLIQDGSYHAFEFLSDRGLTVRRPDRTFATPDHGVSTRRADLEAITEPDQRRVVERLASNTRHFGITHFPVGDPRQGIVHVVGPEQGISLPGLLMVCGDSHTSTHGALGALAFGIGASEVAHVLATQAIWQRRARTMRVAIEGVLPGGVTAKDVSLSVAARIGAAGAGGHVIEYAGAAVRAMSMEQRLTLCNMSIESGARAGMVAPDDVTYDYLAGRPHAPAGRAWERALAYWRTLPSDDDADFDRAVTLDAGGFAPMVSWGTSAAQSMSVDGRVPDPAAEADPGVRAELVRTLDYMGLAPGTPLEGIPVDQVFIGSCTNARIEDLRAAAHIVRGMRVRVPALVVPGSTAVKRAAEAEGLDRVFVDAGCTWGESGCSMCVAMNGDRVGPGQRCASTSNRSTPGRQGPESRTHLMSPAMAAAAAITGRITDVRKLG